MSIPLVAAALGLIFHFGGLEVHRFERLAADDLRSRVSGDSAQVSVRTTFSSLLGGPLGELDEVTVTARDFSCAQLPLFVESQRSRVGRIRLLRLDLRDFELAGLRVQHLVAEIPDCRFDYAAAVRHHRFIITASGSGDARVWVSQEAIAAFAPHKLPMLRDVTVRVDKDKVFVEGSGKVLFLDTQFSVIAGLEVVGGRQFVLASPHVFFGAHATNADAGRAVVSALTPLIDLDKDLGLHGALEVVGLRLRDGVIEAWGTATLPVLPDGPEESTSSPGPRR
jgi:hypothetical protein